MAVETLNIQGSKSVYNQQGTPNTNRYGASEGIVVYTASGGSTRLNSCLEFSLSGLPADATLTSATLSLYVNFANAVGANVAAYKLIRTDWVANQMTWNVYKTGSNWTNAGGDYVTSNPASANSTILAAGNWMRWDILAIVKDAYSNSIPVELLMYKTTTGDGSDKGCHWWSDEVYDSDITLRPKLDIIYDESHPSSPFDYLGKITGADRIRAHHGRKMRNPDARDKD